MTRLLALDGERLADLSVIKQPALTRALALLNANGFEARLVGGAVRDLLLGEPPGDFDLATTATPPEVIALAEKAGIRFAPTGVEHGTVTLILDGSTIEVTTLREDVETDGRRAKVRFGRDFQADAARRDFTLNALSLDAEGRVHDYVGGIADLERRRVRFIGSPRERIREDFLRILRFLRFSARFGEGPMDADGFIAAVTEREGLATLSAERVRAELLKILVARHAPGVLAQAEEAGLIGRLLGGVAYCARLARVVAIESARAARPDALLRLAALGIAVSEDADRLRERLRLSNAESDRLENAAGALERLHGPAAPPSLGELRIRLFKEGRQAAQDGLTLAHAETGAHADDELWSRAYCFLNDTPLPQLPFSGADLVARGVPPGRALGLVLKDLQARWIRAGFPREPERLAELMVEALSDAG